MLLLLIPLAIVGAVLFSRNPAPSASKAVAGRAPSTTPSPIAVLCVFLQQNQRPPDMVVQCAIAEAQILGRNDLVYDLTRAFVAPGQLPAAASPNPQLAKLSLPIATDAKPAEPVPVPTDDSYRTRPMTRAEQDEADMLAALAAQGAPLPPGAQLEPARAPAQQSAQQSPVMGYAIPDDFDLAMPVPAAPSFAPSPIAGVPDVAWSHFCGQLVREAPDFTSQRNVGRYRHRRDRVVAVGFNPDAIVGSIEAQDAVLAADLADAYEHMSRAGDLRHVGRAISIPDVDGAIPATLSGLLGIAAVAGVDGCVGWLENKSDRKRFPHTTQAFLRTNGAF